MARTKKPTYDELLRLANRVARFRLDGEVYKPNYTDEHGNSMPQKACQSDAESDVSDVRTDEAFDVMTDCIESARKVVGFVPGQRRTPTGEE